VRFVLPNGLTWLFAPQHHSPVVAIQIWVKVGSADELPGELGLAHLHEHMLFKGTQRRGPGEIARDVEAHGGEINAWTSFDQTVYHAVLASRFFAQGLDILSDAVRRPLFDAGELAREIEVVVEEIKRSMDMPGRKLSKALFDLAYAVHPYRRPVIGTEASVRGMTREKMQAFFSKHYRPDNMVVAIAGDVSLEAAQAEIQKCFGGAWGQPPRAATARPVEPEPSGLRARVVADDVKAAHVSLSFPIPNVESADIPALDALAAILGQGESARLELAVRRAGLVHGVHASAYTPRDPGLFSVDAALDAGKLEAAVPALLAEVLRLRHEPVRAAELAAAQSMLEADAIYQRETVQGLSRRMGFFEVMAGADEDGAAVEARYHAQVAALTPAALAAAAKKYLAPARCAAVALVPSGTAFDEAALRRAIEGTATPAARDLQDPPPEIPFVSKLQPAGRSGGEARAVQVHTLANGVTVLLKPEQGVPLVAMRAALPGGLLHESDADNGIHQLLARTLTQGAGARSAEDLARLSDAMAGSVSGSAGRNSVGLRGEFPSAHLERGFDLFAECLLAPRFDADEVAREKALQLQAIHTRDDRPSGVAFRLFNRALYGAHPYHLDVQGERESVAALEASALRAAHRARLQGGSLVVALVGDLDPDRALALCEARFGGLPARAADAPSHGAVPPRADAELAHQDAQKAQAQVVYGFPGVRLDDPDRYALEVLSTVLSGQGGRLFVELRDKRSMAYSISCFSLEGLEAGAFAVYLGTSPEKVDAAVEGIRAELQKIRDARVSADELGRAQRYLIGSHAIGFQRNGARAATLALDTLYGLGPLHHLEDEARILAVDAEAVRRAAERFIRFDAAVLAVLGPRPRTDAWRAP